MMNDKAMIIPIIPIKGTEILSTLKMFSLVLSLSLFDLNISTSKSTVDTIQETANASNKYFIIDYSPKCYNGEYHKVCHHYNER